MQVRRLTEDDAQALWNLRMEALETEPQAFRETVEEHRQRTVESYAKFIRDGGDDSFIFGAFESEGRLTGMTGLYRKQRDQGCIWGVYVDPAYRKQGVAKALMDAVLAYARSLADLSAVHLTVARRQASARNLYLRCGFQVSDEKPTSACGGNVPEDQDSMVLYLLQDR